MHINGINNSRLVGDKMIYIATGAFFLSTLFFIFGLLKMVKRKEKVIDKLIAYDEEQTRILERKLMPEEKTGPIRRMAKVLENISSDSKRKKKNLLLYKQADMPITYEEMFVLRVMGSTSFGLLTLAITKDFFITFLVISFIWFLPKFILLRRKKQKIHAFDEQLNEGLVMISNALKAGYSFLQALAVAAEETQNPFAKEFKVLLKELSLGISMEDGLNNLLDRVPSEDLKLIVNAILIQKDVGGNLSEILENIAETIRERQRINNEVRTLTAQGKLSGGIIMAMPFFIGVIIYMFNSEYIIALFRTTLGRILLGVALFSQLMGWLFIRKIVNIEF